MTVPDRKGLRARPRPRLTPAFPLLRSHVTRRARQVISDFCKEIGADGKVRQNLIRTAKNNGGRLGFLA